MSDFVPGLLLVGMILLTVFLLPRLNDERAQRPDDQPQRITEEIHIKRKM